jgi:hypothetical protein
MRPSQAAIVAALIASTAGCVMTPLEVIIKGTHHTGTLIDPPQRAASCIAQNAERNSRYMIGSQREFAGYTEVIIRHTLDTPTTVSVWHIKAHDDRSTFQAWVAPDLIGLTHSDYVHHLRSGC